MLKVIKRSMDLNLLNIFLVIYDAGSVSAAATELDMTQPGVSTALKRLRQEFGDPLFVRTANGMSPTSRARELEEPIRSVISLIDRKILTSDSFDPTTATNEFRIAMPDIGEFGFLPPVMAALAAQAPYVRIRSLSSRFNEIERAMEAGELDLALGDFPDLRSSNMMGIVVSRGAFGCFARPGHPFANDAISLEDFCRNGHILIEPVGRSQERVEMFMRENGIRRNVAMTTSNFLCVPAILARTDLMAIIPKELGKAWGAAPVHLPFELPAVELRMYWHRLVHSNSGHQWLRQLISKALKGLGSSHA